MADALRVALEIGPKSRMVAAVAVDWPGLERGGKTEEDATARLRACAPRYARVAALAGMEGAFASASASASAADALDVVERYLGTGSTDYWGISFAFSDLDQRALSDGELARELALMRACWAVWDSARARVSAQMRKGPRGGGRDRDSIAGHTLRAELDWARKVGVTAPLGDAMGPDDLRAYRDAYCDAIRAHHAEGKMARTWPLRYLIRHTAYHTLDHAWEMEDKDLTGAQ